jgi:DNA repair protein RadC
MPSRANARGQPDNRTTCLAGTVPRAFGNMNQLTLTNDEGSAEPAFVLACGERPQERMEAFGVGALSDTELIATLLQGSGMRAEPAVMLAARLIAEAGSISGLAKWTPEEFQRLKGIGRSKALQLAALAEIARRMIRLDDKAQPLLNRAELIVAYFRPIVAGLEVEKFWVLCLNRKNRLLKRVEVTSGTATAALAAPREVFRPAIREAACAIICVHNHPSGDPAPSAPDLHITRILREASKAVEIELIDHVIMGRVPNDPMGAGWFSFRNAGLL